MFDTPTTSLTHVEIRISVNHPSQIHKHGPIQDATEQQNIFQTIASIKNLQSKKVTKACGFFSSMVIYDIHQNTNFSSLSGTRPQKPHSCCKVLGKLPDDLSDFSINIICLKKGSVCHGGVQFHFLMNVMTCYSATNTPLSCSFLESRQTHGKFLLVSLAEDSTGCCRTNFLNLSSDSRPVYFLRQVTMLLASIAISDEHNVKMATKRLNDTETLKLIQLVQDHPCVWNS